MSRYHWHGLLVVALVLIAVAICFLKPIVKGLDIDGGIRVLMQVDPQRPEDWPTGSQERATKMDAIKTTITGRVKGIQGVAEPRVNKYGEDRIGVELPGVKNAQAALNRIKSTASLEFYYLRDVINRNNPTGQWRMDSPSSEGEPWIFTGPKGETVDSNKQAKEVLSKVVNTKRNPPVITGSDLLSNATSTIGQNGKVVVVINFTTEGTKKFRDFTRAHVDDFLAVFFDGRLLTAPSINEAIPSGSAEISGFRNLQDARGVADQLNSGALPVPLKVISYDAVEPTLGKATVKQVLLAGIVGILLVLLYMAIYYRLPGVLAGVALGLYALFVVAVFKLFGVTLSLPGMAALIISIGMAVDANILIFERLKEELHDGKTLKAAIDAGFSRAFTAIFDSNACTAITCAVLMWYGSPAVQSFALTLLVGVAISMFTAITVSRTFLHLLVGWEWAQNPSLYGLSNNWLSAAKLQWDVVGKRNTWFILSAVIIVPGLLVLATSGLKPGIEFKSGTAIQATFKSDIQLDAVREVVTKYSPSQEVQIGKDKDGKSRIAFIKTLPLESDLYTQLRDDLDKNLGGIATVGEDGTPQFDSMSSVDPTVSKELTRNAFWSVLIACLGIVLYLTSRFAIGGLTAGLKYGVCAVLALVHDAAFLLGLFAILGKFLGWEVDSLFVTAVLTIIGFSVHDTIVVFDRIRENLKHRLRGESFEQLCNRSILQTMSRSINTSFGVVLSLLCLIVFGGPLLRHFYIALLVGIIIGTYSSIFNATQLVIVWDNLAAKSKEPRKKAFEDKPIVEKPMVPKAASTTLTAETEEQAEAAEGEESGTSDAAKAARAKRKTTKKRRF